jgi:hypothetical protein
MTRDTRRRTLEAGRETSVHAYLRAKRPIDGHVRHDQEGGRAENDLGAMISETERQTERECVCVRVCVRVLAAP